MASCSKKGLFTDRIGQKRFFLNRYRLLLLAKYIIVDKIAAKKMQKKVQILELIVKSIQCLF